MKKKLKKKKKIKLSLDTNINNNEIEQIKRVLEKGGKGLIMIYIGPIIF